MTTVSAASEAGGQASEAPEAPPAQAAQSSQQPSGFKNDYFYEHWDKLTRRPPPPKTSKTETLDVNVEDRPVHHLRHNTQGVFSTESTTTSFEEAAGTCRRKVEAIVKECRRLNVKYNDPKFRLPDLDTLVSLSYGDYPDSWGAQKGFVGSVKRVEDVFDSPAFIIDGATTSDVRQGDNGDCWLLAAITALSGTEETGQTLRLLSKLFVARDEKVGVYGFVFFRDGEWISEVVDDRLCLRRSEKDIESLNKKIRGTLSTGSDALYFASCHNSNETWLPLMEKAYAKAHGDYQCIEGGIGGEGIEDLTGGVNVSIDTEDVLDKDVLWKELLRVNKDFLFGCSSKRGSDQDGPDADGFVRGHAYTVLEAREIVEGNTTHRLLRVKNPWAKQEWNGAWSDGSKEWTAERLKALNHTFGDDGMFWISLKDWLTYYRRMDRTRLFGPEWKICQQWTSVEVSYNDEYHSTKFNIEVAELGPIVVVLSQPDERYFQGLTGRYEYELYFRLYKKGEDTYLVRSMDTSGGGRSCSADFHVGEPGSYTVMMKIKASRSEGSAYPTKEDQIKTWRKSRRDKLLTVGHSFDSIHSKGLLRETENNKKQREKTGVITSNKDRKKSMMKAERAYDRENKRRQKLRAKRIEENMKEKKARLKSMRSVTRAEDDQAKTGTAEKSTSGATDGLADAEAPISPPTEADGVDGEAEMMGAADKEAAWADKSQAAPLETPATYMQGSQNNHDYGGNEEEAELSPAEDVDFDWDSEIDDPVDPIVLPEPGADGMQEDDVWGDDPWNAICVVGLRVYSVNTATKISVVKGDDRARSRLMIPNGSRLPIIGASGEDSIIRNSFSA